IVPLLLTTTRPRSGFFLGWRLPKVGMLSAMKRGGVVRMRATVVIFSALALFSPLFAQRTVVADAPEVRGPFALTAVYDSKAGHNAFSYAGKTVPPIIRVLPGGAINLQYVNNLPVHSSEQCALGPCA